MKTALGLSVLAFWLFLIVSLIYGIYLGFVASVIIGFAFVLVPPLGTLTGAVQLVAGINLAERLAVALGLV